MQHLTIEKILGAGCFGFVFQVAHPEKPLSAHKLFLASSNSAQNDNNPTTLQEFEREGNMLDMDHPNVVHLHTIEVIPVRINILEWYKNSLPESEHGTVFDRLTYHTFGPKVERNFPIIRITMQLCGPSLKKWLESATTQNTDADFTFRRQIGEGLINGLRYLHEEKSVIHRDLKPDNVLFSNGDGFVLPVKIGDFGLSRPFEGEGSGSKSAGVGSHLYRAPEVGGEHDPSARYSQRADLFSLGLILWEVFELIPLKERYTLFDELVNDRDENVVQDNDIFPRLKDAIIGLTKKHSKDRIQSIAEVDPFS